MRMVDAFHKDVHAIVEHSLEDLEKIMLALDNAQLNYSDGNPDIKEAAEHVKNEFYPQLIEIIKALKGLPQ